MHRTPVGLPTPQDPCRLQGGLTPNGLIILFFGEWTKNRPVFLTGDFNSRPGSDVYKILVGDENSNNLTFLKDSKEGGIGIDWILYKGRVKVLSYENIDYNVNGTYPSDHRPILVEFEILEE